MSNEIGEDQNGDRIVLSDPDDYAKTQKIRRLTSLKSKVQRWDKPGFTEIETYYNRIFHYGTELLPVIQEALEHGTIVRDDLRFEMDSTSTGPTLDVLRFLQTGKAMYVSSHDGIERFQEATFTPDLTIQIGDERKLRKAKSHGAHLHRETLDRHFSQLVQVETKLGLGFNFETQKGPAQL